MRRIDLRGTHVTRGAHGIGGGTTAKVDYRSVVPRAAFDVDAATAVIKPICVDVRDRGLAAMLEYSARFDGVDQTDVRVPEEEIERALTNLDSHVRAGLVEAVRRLRLTCAAELEHDVVTDLGPGARVTHRKVPVDRVGLYVPGGLAPLVSSVVMNVVPAQVAGVRSLALTSSPQKDHDGLPHPTILAACALLGIEEVYAAGGAQAIAMFAYGIPDVCERVDLVTGPGNIYVVSAKRYLKGIVGIDAEAGPTEIAVLADDSAEAAFVAADLISQAEHDPLAASVLITDSDDVAAAVELELDVQVAAAKHADRIRTALMGEQSAIVMVTDLAQGIEVLNGYAAEHVEIHTRKADTIAGLVRNAGAVFIGPYAPVSLGDYSAGSNHVLPTGGCACHSSGLSVRSFLKSMHVVDYSQSALAQVADHVMSLAEAEDLPGHAEAIRVRAQ